MSYFKINGVEWEPVKNPYKVKKIEYLFKNLKDKKYLDWYVVAESYYGIGDVLISETPNGFPKYQLLHDDIKDIIPVKQTKTMNKLRDLKESYETLFESAIKEIDFINKQRRIEEHKLNESIKGSILRKGIRHMNDKQLSKCINSIIGKLEKKNINREYIIELKGILNDSDTEIKRGTLLKIINKMEEKNPKKFKSIENDLEEKLENENILKEDFLSEKWWSPERGKAIAVRTIIMVVDIVIQAICFLTLEIIFPLMLPIDIFMLIFAFVSHEYDGYGLNNREKKRIEKLINSINNNNENNSENPELAMEN